MLEDFTVGGKNCRLLYLDGKCERNEKEQWITQLGFHWEYMVEEEFYSCAMSTTSSQPSSYPSSFKMDRLRPAIYQTMSSNSVVSEIGSRFSDSMSTGCHSTDPMQMCEMLLRQIRMENDQLRSELQNMTSVSVEKIFCYACSQYDGEKVALSCGHLVCQTCFEHPLSICPKCKARVMPETAIYLK